MNQPYTVRFDAQALKDLKKLDKPVRLRISLKIQTLTEDPRPAGSIPLKGHTESWRVKVGDYRVIYVIHDGELLVMVVGVAHRREVYRDL